MLNDEMPYRVLRLLDADPQMSQRDVARALGVSLGKTNYCVRALVRKGCVKVKLRNSGHKAGCIYLLTPRGLQEKGKLTRQFLRDKISEYELLRDEIRQLRQEVARPQL